MKIDVVEYNPEWPAQFQHLNQELLAILEPLSPTIEHIGSTAIPDLAAKPVIDIAVGLSSLDDLDRSIPVLIQYGYIYYEVFNEAMPERRLFVRVRENPNGLFQSIYTANDQIPHEEIQQQRLAHVHIWVQGSSEWTRHIAFREYLKAHASVREQYARLKKRLSQQQWEHGMAYNDGKDNFIKTEQVKALEWYSQKHKAE